MNWRLEVAICLVFTLAFVGLGLMVAAPVESAPAVQVHFSQGLPRPKVQRRVLGHPGRGKRHFNRCFRVLRCSRGCCF
jgi:hypothetical protein